MDPVRDSIFTILGAALATLITENKSDILLFLTGKMRSKNELKATWDCEWHMRPMTADKQSGTIVPDFVIIESVTGEKLAGTGRNPTSGASYHLQGTLSDSSIFACSWFGDGDQKHLRGVALLRLNETRNKMNGYWCQISPEGQFVGGEVLWKKRPG